MLEMLITETKKSGSAQDYNGFLAYLAAHPEIAEVVSTNTIGSAGGLSSSTPLLRKCKIIPGQGTMFGSPYLTYTAGNAAVSRVTQHACPNINTYNENASNTRYCLIKTTYPGLVLTFQAVNRNGYSSMSYNGANGRDTQINVTEFIYYDSATMKMMTWNPMTNSTPAIWIPPN